MQKLKDHTFTWVIPFVNLQINFVWRQFTKANLMGALTNVKIGFLID